MKNKRKKNQRDLMTGMCVCVLVKNNFKMWNRINEI